MNEEKLTELICKLRDNYPIAASTFGNCINDCGNSARGCGQCADCIEKQLSELVGEHKASLFHDLTRESAKLVSEMYEVVEGEIER